MGRKSKEQKELEKSLAKSELSLEILKIVNNFKSTSGIELTSDDKLFVLSKIVTKELEKKK